MKSIDQPILIASDHAGVALKAELIRLLSQWKWEDLGPQNTNRVDYPDYASRLALKIVEGKYSRGILICGTGIGMSISANKIPGIRAAVAENPVSARLSREHNHSNILCLGARFTAPEYGAEIVEAWLNAVFSQDPRHQQRLDKITALELSVSRKD